jgi:hypothetical protein
MKLNVQESIITREFTRAEIDSGMDPVAEMRRAVGHKRFCQALVWVSKPLAHKWLNKMAFNRRKSTKYVNHYQKDMDDGHWLLTNQGLGFSSFKGRLIDGQNRLWAFLNSKLEYVLMPITVNLAKGAQYIGIDQIYPRSLAHQISIMQEKSIDPFEITVANFIWYMSPASLGSMTFLDRERYLREYNTHGHKSDMEWVMGLYESLPYKRYHSKKEPAIMASAARAYAGIVRDQRLSSQQKKIKIAKIVQFVKVALNRTTPTSVSDWAYKLHELIDYIRNETRDKGGRAESTKSGTCGQRRAFYLKVNLTLWKYLNDVPCYDNSKLMPSNREQFPFREEKPGLEERMAIRMKSSKPTKNDDDNVCMAPMKTSPAKVVTISKKSVASICSE